MISKGIRISDSKPVGKIEVLAVSLKDVLELINNGNRLSWALLELEATGILGMSTSILEIEKKIRSSKNGLFISWNRLLSISQKFQQILWITVIGCKDKNHIKKYTEDQNMYESCDIVIEIIDGSCCEVFSKDYNLIQNLHNKYKKSAIINAN